jgi:hypothetical protein
MPNQLTPLAQGTTGNGVVLAVNDRLRRISQANEEAATATATAQSSADAAQASADAAQASALQADKNLSDVPNKPLARQNLAAVSRTTIVASLGTAGTTYNQAQMAEVITVLNQIITALDA